MKNKLLLTGLTYCIVISMVMPLMAYSKPSTKSLQFDYPDFCVDENDTPKYIDSYEVISIKTQFYELTADGPEVNISHYYAGHHREGPFEEGDWTTEHTFGSATVVKLYAVYYDNQCRGTFKVRYYTN